ncbi:hypothetical protein [Nocardiopsis sp. FR26]|uniref:hypothetical protein n=1 Tax=Nocardiopsis sp. FR26 TaxID=2605987 RepID=UPI00135CF6AA|nr:hypothetical protein [Nocardiopsis sp. FR26]
MTTTTSFGTWNNHGDRTQLTVEATVAAYISGGSSEWLERVNEEGHFNAMVDAYRDAINAALPDGVTLNGNEFYGPYYAENHGWDEDLNDELGQLNITAIIETIDLAAIVERHDPDLINQDATLDLGAQWHTLTIGDDIVIDLPVRVNEVIPAALLREIADLALTDAGWERTGPWGTPAVALHTPVTRLT